MTSSPRVLGFGDFSLDLGRGLLLRNQQPLPLRRQSFDVLRYLVERRGTVVSKNELVSAVWMMPPAQPEASLTQCIKDIRQVLGDTERWMIRTVSGSGYMFTPEVTVLHPTAHEASPPVPLVEAATESGNASPASASPRHADSGWERLQTWAHQAIALVPFAQWRHSAIAAGVLVLALVGGGALLLGGRSGSVQQAAQTMMATPSIAVLPFSETLADTTDSDLAQEIATELMRVPRGFNIAIRSEPVDRSAEAGLKARGHEPVARYGLGGTVRREGGIAHLVARLIEIDGGRQIWAESFDYVPSEPGSRNRAAARVARTATDALLMAESKRPLPRDIKADHYAMLGRALLSGKGNAKAIADAMTLFEKALRLDPASVPALQGVARTKISAVDGGWATPAQRALWLDQSEQAIAKIIEKRPRSYGAYRLRGSLHRARGDPEQAIKAFERALELNSSYGSAYAEMGRTKIELGRAADAIADIKMALAFGPADPASHSWLLWAGQAAAHAGDDREALDWLQRAHEADPEQSNVALWLAIAHAGLGQLDAARVQLSRHMAANRGFTLHTWNEAHPRRNPVVAGQRARLETLLRQLNVPEGKLSAANK